MDFLANLLPHLLNGVSLGLLFALIALGFMLIVGVMEVINLAHGSLFALGAYVAITLMGWKVSYALAFLLAPLVVGGVGMLLELCLRRTYGKDPLYGLLLTFGAALVLEELIRLAWGSNEQQLQVPAALTGPLFLGGLIYAKYRFFASLAATFPSIDFHKLSADMRERVATHGIRRAAEMREAAEMLAAAGLEPGLASAVADSQSRGARSRLAAGDRA